MPICLKTPLRARLSLPAFTVLAFLLLAGTASAKSAPVDLKVIAGDGEVLASHTQYTDTVSLKTDPEASCFGQGTEGSGAKVKVPGKTALGAVVDGQTGDLDLKPVSVTDAFDFGLGLCGIGNEVAPDTGFWYLKTNHVESQTGGDLTKVGGGDEVVWFLDTDFADAPPAELELDAPARNELGTDFPVQVFEYAADGTRTPAAGVTVTGANQPTDATGTTTVNGLTTPRPTLSATRAGAIPDDVRVCAAESADNCPQQVGGIIGGSASDDEIRDTDDADNISMGKGDDEVNTRDGSADDINCGSGDDSVKADAGDDPAKNCEKVRTK